MKKRPCNRKVFSIKPFFLKKEKEDTIGETKRKSQKRIRKPTKDHPSTQKEMKLHWEVLAKTYGLCQGWG